MRNKIFIGGLSFDTTEETLRAELEKHGSVTSLRIVTDRDTGRSKGYGFVTYETEEGANKAIEALDNQMFDGRRIGVKPNIKQG